MGYIEFDTSRLLDLILLGRVAIDFNPAYNAQVKEEFKPLKKVHTFEMFLGRLSGKYHSRSYPSWSQGRFYRKSI